MSRSLLRSLALLAWCLVTASPSLATIPPPERAALIALYNATNGPGWTNHTGWLDTPGTECSWYGVTCDAGQTTVRYLALNNNQLSGSMPPELGNLSGLWNLYLYSNQLSESIPPELGSLTSLIYLRLYSNQLTGSIPTQLGSLTSLFELSLHHNQLTGSIPTQLGSLTNLRTLWLDANQLTGSIPTQLGSLTRLQFLYLDNDDLTGSIPTQLGSLTSLYGLGLGSNQLTGSIPTQLGNLGALHYLRLCCNQLTGSIPTELGDLTSLQALDLSLNQLTGSIPTQLGGLSSLQNLYLAANPLSGSIPTELGSLGSSLVELELAFDQLSGSIPTELGNLSTLRDLGLDSNQLSGSIPTQLGNLSGLRYLVLSSNQLTGVIPTELGSLTGLQDLYLRNNQLTGTIPTQIGNLTALALLFLDYNQLSGSIPTELGGLSSLQRLNLDSNQLTGSIPTQLSNLSTLQELELDSNQLTGTVPAGILDTLARFNALRAASGPYDGTQTVAPGGITTATGGTGSVLVSWTPIYFVEYDGGYRVLYSTSPSGPFTQYGETVDKTVSSLMVEGLSPATPYYFIVETVTYPHPNNQGTVLSEASAPVLGSTASSGPHGALQLSLSSYVGSEGEAKAVTALRLGGSTGAVSVLYSTSPGTALPGVDYVPTSEWLAWSDGDAEPKSFTVQILHSSTGAGKTFNVNLSNPTGGATLGSPSTAVVTIDASDLPSSGEGDTSSTGYGPAVTSDPNGNRLVVWAASGVDGDGLGLLAQRYVPSGTLAGARIPVTTTTAGDQRAPAVGATASGNFVVTWVGTITGRDGRPGGDGIFGRVFGPGGTPVTPELPLNGTALAGATAESVAVRPTNGSFLVAWQGTASKGRPAGEGIFGRTFGGDGTPLTPELVIDGGQTAEASHPATGVNDSGAGVVVWSRQDQFGWDDVYAQRLDASGNLLGFPILVNVDTFRDQTNASVVVQADGRFAVLWQGPSLPDAQGNRVAGSDIYVRSFSSAGVPQGDAVVVNPTIAGTQSNARLMVNGSGDCWAVWEDSGSGGGVGVFGRPLTSPCDTVSGGQQQLYSPSGGTSLRQTAASYSDTGAVTAVFVRDDTVEGDGSVVGYSLNQPAAGWIFGDGFERGNTSVWSATVP